KMGTTPFSKRQAVAGSQGPALDPAHGARQVRGTAVQNGRNGDPSSDRQIGTGAAAMPAKTKHRTGTDRERRVDGHRAAVDGDVEVGARHSRDPLVFELHL